MGYHCKRQLNETHEWDTIINNLECANLPKLIYLQELPTPLGVDSHILTFLSKIRHAVLWLCSLLGLFSVNQFYLLTATAAEDIGIFSEKG